MCFSHHDTRLLHRIHTGALHLVCVRSKQRKNKIETALPFFLFVFPHKQSNDTYPPPGCVIREVAWVWASGFWGFFVVIFVIPPDLQKTANPPNASQRLPTPSQHLPTPPNTSQHPSNLARILGFFFLGVFCTPFWRGFQGGVPVPKSNKKIVAKAKWKFGKKAKNVLI